MALGLDRQVQERVAAYQGNPAALQKNYQMNQNLLDLLALQKIKSEKDAAKRELELSMEQNPRTISQQRGEEAIQRTKDELAKQVGGIAGQRQAVQQKNIQRAAAGAPPAPPPGAPGARPANPQQMAGIANQPAPNMARMAGGGIVNFAGKEGSQVKAMTPEELLASVNFKGGVERFKGLDPAAQQRVLNTINSRRSRLRPGVAESIMDRGLSWLGDMIKAPLVAGVNVTSDMLRGLGVMGPTQKGFLEQPLNSLQQQSAARAARHAADPRLQPVSMGQLQPPPAVSSKVPPPAQAQAQAQNQGIQPTTTTTTTPASPVPPVAAGGIAEQYQKLLAEQDKYFRRSADDASYANMLDQQTALNERNKASRGDNRIYDLLARAGGQGPLANIGRAASDLRAGDRLEDQLALSREQDIKGAGIKSYRASGDKAATHASTLSGEISKAAQAKEKAIIERERNEIMNRQITSGDKRAAQKLATDIETHLWDAEVAARKLIELKINNGIQSKSAGEAGSEKRRQYRARVTKEVMDNYDKNRAALLKRHRAALGIKGKVLSKRRSSGAV